MSPRPYQLGLREPAVFENRGRILAAAREILGRPGRLSHFTVGTVAHRAGVARATVYYQFQNKSHLVEAIYDDLAARGGLRGLPEAFARPDPMQSLQELIAVFCRFWASDRLVLSRVRALSVLDPELQEVGRDSWRRQGLAAILARMGIESDDAIDALWVLTSLETYNVLATEDRDREQVAELIQKLARAALGAVPPSKSPSPARPSRGGGRGRRARSG